MRRIHRHTPWTISFVCFFLCFWTLTVHGTYTMRTLINIDEHVFCVYFFCFCSLFRFLWICPRFNQTISSRYWPDEYTRSIYFPFAGVSREMTLNQILSTIHPPNVRYINWFTLVVLVYRWAVCIQPNIAEPKVPANKFTYMNKWLWFMNK